MKINLCFNCMEEIEKNIDVCPHCHKNVDEPQSPPFLPKKISLTGRYIVGQGLEINGESLCYVAYDSIKNTKVYLKEFFPSIFCERHKDFTKVVEKANSEKTYKNLMETFLRYYRNVAKLRNLPAINAVFDIFTENGTAYVVFEWIEGTRLDKYLSQKNSYLRWEEARILFMPLFSAFSGMHTAKILHLGICPENIFVTKEGKLRATGFATKNLRKADSPINHQLYSGCSALEQYIEIYETDESTDIYGLAATIFLCLTGEYPPTATSRKENDELLMPQNVLENLPKNVVSALANALRVYPNNRTLSFEIFNTELSDSPVSQVKQENENKKFTVKVPQKKKSSNLVWGVIVGSTALLLLISLLGVYWFWLKGGGKFQTTQQQTVETTKTQEEQPNETLETTKMIPVPDLTDKNYKNLIKDLENNSEYSVLLLSEEFSDTVGEGNIISQSPVSGQEMCVGSYITVSVSRGTQKRQLPNIEGKSLSDASLSLTEKGFKPTAAKIPSEKYEEGTVVGYKDYNAGDSVDFGTEITILVSVGN